MLSAEEKSKQKQNEHTVVILISYFIKKIICNDPFIYYVEALYKQIIKMHYNVVVRC